MMPTEASSRKHEATGLCHILTMMPTEASSRKLEGTGLCHSLTMMVRMLLPTLTSSFGNRQSAIGNRHMVLGFNAVPSCHRSSIHRSSGPLHFGRGREQNNTKTQVAAEVIRKVEETNRATTVAMIKAERTAAENAEVTFFRYFRI